MWLFLAVLGLHCCMGFSLVAASGDPSLVAVRRLLVAVASLVERGLSGRAGVSSGGPRLESTGAYCSSTCGTVPDQESVPCLLNWQVGSLPLSHQGSPSSFCVCVT